MDVAYDEALLRERFAAAFPLAKIEWADVVYMLPMSLPDHRVVEPLFVVSFSTLQGGIASRRQYVGYRLIPGGEDLDPIVLTETADSDATGDLR